MKSPPRRKRHVGRPALAVETDPGGEHGAGQFTYRLAAGAALLLIGCMAFFPVQSDDVFMYLAIGRRFFRDGGFPKADPFLFSIPDYHWHILHEWASHLIAYGLYVAGGWTALIVAKTAGIMAIAAMPLVVAARLGKRSAIVPLLIVLACMAGNHRFIERSSLFSDFFTAAVLAILLCERVRPGRAKYALPIFFLSWVNLHPGFFTGMALCGLAVLVSVGDWRGRAWLRLAGCVGVSVLCLLANPAGLSGVLYPLRPLFDATWEAYRQFNFEWMPTTRAIQAGQADAIAFLVIAGVCAALWVRAVVLNAIVWNKTNGATRRWPVFEAIALILLSAQGLNAVRFLPTASFSLAVLGAALGARGGASARVAPERRVTRLVITGGAGLWALVHSVMIVTSGYGPAGHARRPGVGLDPRQHPDAAAAFIERINVTTPIFNQHEFGSYLAWRWDGARKLYYHGFVDDLEFYQHEYMAVNESAEEFARIVETHHVGAFFLTRLNLDPRTAPPLYQQLLTRPEWRLAYADDRAVLFLRDVPENAEALARAAAEVGADTPQ